MGINFHLQELIENTLKKNRPLRHVILAFAKEIFLGKPIPVYDEFNEFLTKVFQRYFPDKKCFSWIAKRLEDDTITVLDRATIENSIERANTDISDIEIPLDFLQYEFFDYPIVNETYFNRQCDFCLVGPEDGCNIQ